MKFSTYKSKREGKSVPRENYICRWAVIRDYAAKKPLEMAIYEKQNSENSGRDVFRVVELTGGKYMIDGVRFDEADARRFAASHSRDVERLLVEAAKGSGDDKQVVRDLQIATLADKAGDAGTYAVLLVKSPSGTRRLQVGRNEDGPLFRLDGEEIKKEEAAAFIYRNYMSFLMGIDQAIAGLNGYRVETKAEEPAKGSGGKILVNLDDFLPPANKAPAKDVDVSSIGDKLFAKRGKQSYLKGGD